VSIDPLKNDRHRRHQDTVFGRYSRARPHRSVAASSLTLDRNVVG